MSWQSSGYRYGFGSHENDNDIKGEGNHSSFGDYGYDPRTARRYMLEPMIAKYPSLSPYVAYADNPIYYRDPDGLENIPALNWALKNMANKGIGNAGYRDSYLGGSENRWTYNLDEVPNITVCYESCFMAYLNSGEIVLSTLKNGFTNNNLAFKGRVYQTGGMNWFKSGDGSDRKFVTDISQGELGDIVFMGEDTPNGGHAVLLASSISIETAEIDGKKTEKATFYTLSTSSDTDDGNYGGREFIFIKQGDGTWKQKGGAGYTFKGFGQMTNVEATDEIRKKQMI